MYQKCKHSKITLRRLKLGLSIIIVLKLVMDCICCFKPARSAEWGGFLPQRSLNKFGDRSYGSWYSAYQPACSDLPMSQGFPFFLEIHSSHFFTFWNFPEIWKYLKLPQLWGSETHQQHCHIFMLLASVPKFLHSLHLSCVLTNSK